MGACALENSSQRILDFDFDLGYCGVTLTSGKVLTGSDAGKDLPTGYRTLVFNGLDLDRDNATTGFNPGARPKRVSTFFDVPIEIEDPQTGEITDESKVISIVSLSPDDDGDQKLAIIDITLPEAPELLRIIPFPEELKLGILQSVSERADGLLALATTTDIVLLDPILLAKENPSDPAILHPAVQGFIRGTGTGHISIAESGAGINVVNLGGRSQVVQTAPELSFVYFPTLTEFVDPSAIVDDDAGIEDALAAMVTTKSLVPGRFRDDGGATATLKPPAPQVHYHVLIRAPGGAGDEIKVALESLNRNGYPLRNMGRDFPAVRTMTSQALDDLKQKARASCDADIDELKAYRLSSDEFSPYHNLYLSDPIALTYERMSSTDLTDLNQGLTRAILWSGYGLRASLDPELRSDAILGPFASEVDTSNRLLAVGTSVVAKTLPAIYVLGKNPPPVGGRVDAPGTFGHVSAHNGEVRVDTTDISLPGRRMPIVFTRSFGGQDLYEGPFGRGWDFNYNQRLIALDGDVFPEGSLLPLVVRQPAADDTTGESRDLLFQTGTGGVIHFAFAGDDSNVPSEVSSDPLIQELGWDVDAIAYYLPVRGSFDVIMAFATDEFVRLTPDGMQYWYGPRGKLQRIYHRYTNNFHQVVYNDRGEIKRIIDHSVDEDRFLDFGYHRFQTDSYYDSEIDDATTKPYVAGKIARIRDYADRDIEFLYNDDGILEHRDGFDLSGANGGFSGRPRTTYQVDQSCGGNLQSVVQGNGSGSGGSASGTALFSATLSNPQEQPTVTAGTGAGGDVSFSAPATNAADKVGTETASAVGPDDSKTSFEFDDYGYPEKMSLTGSNASQADFETTFTEDGLAEEIVYPEGNSVSYTYDSNSTNFRSRGNLLTVTRDPGPRPGSSMTATYSDYDEKYNLPKGNFTDFDGNVITLTLDADGLDVESRKYGSSGTDEYTYNDFGQLERFESAEGVLQEFEYDADDGFTTAYTKGGNKTSLTYDSTIPALLGMPTTEDLPVGDDFEWEYDLRLLRTKLKRGDNYAEKRAYDENGNLLTLELDVESGKTRKETRTYNQINFLEEVIVESVEVDGAPTNLVTSFEPDDAWRVKAINHPGGVREEFEYDHLGHLIKLTRGTYVEDYKLDLHGSLLELKRGGDVVATFEYDGFDRVDVVNRKLGGQSGDEVTDYDYFDNGALKSVEITDPVEGLVYKRVVNSRDERGRAKQVTHTGDDDSPQVSFTYTTQAGGGATIKTSSSRSSATVEYDGAGQIIKSTTPLRVVDFDLDENGKVERIDYSEDGSTYWESFTYDGLEYPLSHSDGIGKRFDFIPRWDGFNKSIANGRGMTTQQVGSKLGEVIQRTLPSGVEFNYEYAEHRSLSAIEDKSAKGRAWKYDDTFRPTETSYRDDSKTTFDQPDGRNRPTMLTMPGGTVTVGYDRQGRLTSEDISYGSLPNLNHTYRYDALGRLREAGYDGEKTTYDFDKLGPLRKVDYQENGLSYQVASDIYLDGNRKSVTYASGAQVTEQRGADGRISQLSVSGAGAGLDGVILDVTSFAGADMIELADLGGVIRIDNRFDGRRRMTATRYTRTSDSALLTDLRYRYLAYQNPEAIQYVHDSGRVNFISIDSGDRVQSFSAGARPTIENEVPFLPTGLNPPDPDFAPPLWRRSYSYDSNDLDLLTTATTVNPNGIELPPFAESVSGHDAFLFGTRVDFTGVAPGFDRGSPDPLGNTTKTILYVRAPGASQPVPVEATLEYDGKARLIRVDRADGVTIEYAYRHDHELRRRTVRRGGTTESDLAYIWDRGRIVEIFDAGAPSSTPLARFYYADQDAPIAADLEDGTGALRRFYYLRDRSHTVVAVADSSGEVVERIRYDAWGQPAIERRDDQAPMVARVLSQGGDLLVEFSEPVTPPLVGAGPGSDFVTSYASLANAFTVENDFGALAGTIRFEEAPAGAARGAVLRFVPSAPILGPIAIRLSAGSMVDGWGNPNPAVVLTGLSFTPDGVLQETVPAPLTGPSSTARSVVDSPFLFHGQPFDYEAGISYMRARFYDPGTGTFLQRDPEGYRNSPNLYAAFANNPITHRDPRGLAIADDIAEALGGITKVSRGAGGEPLNPVSFMRGPWPLGSLRRSTAARRAQTRHGPTSGHSADPDSTVIDGAPVGADTVPDAGAVANVVPRQVQLRYVGQGSGFRVYHITGTDRALRVPLERSVGAVMDEFDKFRYGHELFDEMGLLKFHGAYRPGELVINGTPLNKPAFEMEFVPGFRAPDHVDAVGGEAMNGSIYGRVTPTGAEKTSARSIENQLERVMGEQYDFQYGISFGSEIRNVGGIDVEMVTRQVRVVDPPKPTTMEYLKSLERLQNPSTR
jgi:RHS repeat-associated protein